MEKKKVKFIHIIFVFSLLMFLTILGVELWLKYIKSNWSVISLTYWILLVNLIINTWLKKITSNTLLGTGFWVFVFGSIISALFTEGTVGETIIRFSFVFWLVGLGLAVYEKRKIEKST